MIKPAAVKNTGLFTVECLNSSEELVLVGFQKFLFYEIWQGMP